MSPPHRSRRNPAPRPELTPAQEQALQDADVALGRLDVPEPVHAGLRRLGFAAEVGRERAGYLTLAGWAARDRIVNGGQPSTSAGPFTAATGQSVLTDRTEHAEAARRAWQSTLELRRLTSEEMTVPAQLEQTRPVHSIALALEAAGIPPADIDPTGRCLHTGYQVLALGGAVAARVEWKRAAGDDSGPSADEGLAHCRSVLLARGWSAARYLATGRRPYLVVWPAGEREPLL